MNIPLPPRTLQQGTNDEREESDELLEDLESIKDLLDRKDHEVTGDVASTDNPAPLIDDPVENITNVDQGMSEETFNALLGNTWQDSLEGFFNDARARIEECGTAWLPEHSDELGQVLKIRIDASVQAWLEETLKANIGRLRQLIVSELSSELLGHLNERLNHPPSPNLDTQG